MTNQNVQAAAPDRLAKAIEAIDTNLEDGQEVENVLALLRDEVATLTADRERLQEELQAAERNAQRLKRENEEVSERISKVINAIRKVLKESE
jgi:FtsZ-binding cell division protein ZapB